jgi:hypothetical protein
MRSLTSIIKAPRRIARDTREQFADADEFFDGGIDTLTRWLSENVSDGDLESLTESIRIVLHRRVQDKVTGAMDSRATKGFASRYPAARNIRRIA